MLQITAPKNAPKKGLLAAYERLLDLRHRKLDGEFNVKLEVGGERMCRYPLPVEQRTADLMLCSEGTTGRPCDESS